MTKRMTCCFFPGECVFSFLFLIFFVFAFLSLAPFLLSRSREGWGLLGGNDDGEK